MSKTPSLRYAALMFFSAMMLSSGGAFAQSAFDDPGARGKGGAAAGGDFKPVAEKVDAGEVALGATAQVVVLFRNDDGKPLKTGAINLYPSSNISAAVGENQCVTAAIQPGEVCAISLSVKGLQSGNYRIEMLMRHEGRAKLLTTTINGRVAASNDQSRDLISEIEVIPNKIDFGDLDESRSQVKAVVLRNKTSKPIEIQSIDVEAGNQSGYSVTSNCKELATGAACVASVTWTPAQRGPSTGTLIVRHSGATEINTVELTGEYDPDESEMAEIFPEAIPGKGLLLSSLEEVDFGSNISESSSMAVSLVNGGDVPLTITGVRMANAENGVRAEKTGCRPGTVLSPLEACPLTLTWEPVREGNIIDDVQISHTGARGVLILPLRGAASRAINKDRKAIMLTGGDTGMDAVMSNIRPLTLADIEEDGEVVIQNGDKAVVNKPQAQSAAENTSGDKEAASKETASAKTTAAKAPKAPSAQPAAQAEDVDEYTMIQRRMAQIDVRGTLDGYTISSFSPRRAIIAGPGGSRVVFDGEQTVIGGVLWEITMRPSAIEFKSGEQKVLLLFDKSLSSVNLLNGQSSSGSSSSSTTSSSTSSSTSSGTQ
jgi:hypothetical protein